MNKEVRGTRPRPRVALLGKFDAKLLEQYRTLFPTIWITTTGDELYTRVHPHELDLIIIAPDFRNLGRASKHTEHVNVICFSDGEELSLPGPIGETYVQVGPRTISEEFKLPPIALPFSRVREAELKRIGNVKGWRILSLKFRMFYPKDELQRKKHKN